MRLQRWFLGLCLGGALTAHAANTSVQLLLSHEVARPGETILAGVRLQMASGWHTYWRNSGDSGDATRIRWSLPPGITAGAIQWAVPERLKAEGLDLVTYVYHGEVLLMVPFTIAADVAPGVKDIKASISWLECEQTCIAEKGEAAVQLTIGDASKPSRDAARFDAAKKKLPETRTNLEARASWTGPARGDTRVVRIEWTAAPGTAQGEFFPFTGGGFTVKTTNEQHKVTSGKVLLERGVTISGKGAFPTNLGGLLVEAGTNGETRAYETVLPITEARAGPAERRTEERASAPDYTLLGALGAAFLGGLILNLMPCVLPVLALKVVSFAKQSQEAPARVRFLALVYAAGVLVSFLILAGIAIAVNRGWGMQFQNPQFLVCITVLVTVLALSLFGVFEITPGGAVMDAAGNLSSREGAAGAFFNGVVAVVLGTACTAPVLGGALGFATVTQSSPLIIATFLAVGAGMAAPYVLLSFFPALRRWMPKPGAWMDRFKVALGFPMLATAVWLLWQLHAHFGNDGILWMGLFLVVVAIAAWVFGQFVQRGSSRRGLAWGIVAALLITGYGVALEAKLDWRSPAEPAVSGAVARTDPDGIDWQPWSPEALAAARASGRPVLVDFTADWCLNCKVNKQTSLEISSTRQRLKEIQAVSLLGDFTRYNPLIHEELKRHRRAGVPLVLVYPKDPTRPPIVLPEILTPSIVLDALDQAVKAGD